MKNAGNAGQSAASVAGAPEGTLNPIHSSWHGGGLSLRVRRARATPSRALLIAYGREASANSLGIILFADPHLLTQIESYPYKNHGGVGIGLFQSEESSELEVSAAD
jgi:hypothetical protein